MGEKKMLQKERKSPSQQKKAVTPTKPKPWRPFKSCLCPSLSSVYYSYHNTISGSGGITKSWSPPSSSCGVYQTWPQLVSANEKRGFCVFSGTGRKKHNRVIEPYNGDDRYNEFAEFINAVEFQGLCYATSLQGCLAIFEGTSRQIVALGRHRVVPRCKLTKHFREYLLECNGVIYVVFLLSRTSINVVDDVEVSRLDTSRLSWEKVDRLKGDAMFFLQDDCCLGISASVLGCSKGSNCVYFTHDRADDDSWFVFDMETSCVSPTSGPEVDMLVN